MDLSIRADQAFRVGAERLYQQTQGKPTGPTESEDASFMQLLEEKENKGADVTARAEVLSPPEVATLYALFGGERPTGDEFYGKNASSQIYKGHLIDVAG